jgi:hypothetical protein
VIVAFGIDGLRDRPQQESAAALRKGLLDPYLKAARLAATKSSRRVRSSTNRSRSSYDPSRRAELELGETVLDRPIDAA